MCILCCEINYTKEMTPEMERAHKTPSEKALPKHNMRIFGVSPLFQSTKQHLADKRCITWQNK